MTRAVMAGKKEAKEPKLICSLKPCDAAGPGVKKATWVGNEHLKIVFIEVAAEKLLSADIDGGECAKCMHVIYGTYPVKHQSL